MTLSFPRRKVKKLQTQCENLFNKKTVTLRKLNKLIRRLAPLQYRPLQHQQIQGMITQNSCEKNESFDPGKDRTAVVDKKPKLTQ